ncbi:MAG TPA: Na+/H+ antiporter subunit E [Rhodanobacteraceae bacterium]|nr:Na+/H+ antiporter subunit E [Rhodanobacteraceae bacterium]
MKRWLAHPLLVVMLLMAWLVLQQSLAVGTILTGLIIGLGLSRLWTRLDAPHVRVRHVGKLLVLGFRVVVDIITSNWAVARLIVTRRKHTSAFVAIELEMEQPAALAVLACIITATPGTIWVSHDSHLHRLTIHVLDIASRKQLVHNIKQRYEPPLREIFR